MALMMRLSITVAVGRDTHQRFEAQDEYCSGNGTANTARAKKRLPPQKPMIRTMLQKLASVYVCLSTSRYGDSCPFPHPRSRREAYVPPR
jgi:hypothetical protein